MRDEGQKERDDAVIDFDRDTIGASIMRFVATALFFLVISYLMRVATGLFFRMFESSILFLIRNIEIVLYVFECVLFFGIFVMAAWFTGKQRFACGARFACPLVVGLELFVMWDSILVGNGASLVLTLIGAVVALFAAFLGGDFGDRERKRRKRAAMKREADAAEKDLAAKTASGDR